ncbi:MAG TPA: 4-hydroxyphenylacetate 3-hydroxylase N-terminal domain-containing protein [Aestuariivirga sp.]|nr:4-hydroxyphenylacetate 3-hydroxylase N-terminal domain-containing protein [Aestuariivirga sp.]
MSRIQPNSDPALWGHFDSITTAEEYVDSLRSRRLRVYLMGELVDEPADHPMIRPSVNAMAATYAIAGEDEDLGTVASPLAETRINRFLHIAQSADDLVDKARLQHALGQKTGTCFQRCVGLDALNTLHSVTYEIDAAHGTDYHQRFLAFLKEVQKRNQVIGGAMTDAKGDRSKAPHEQIDPDVYVHVSRRDADGIYITGAKLRQTGCINSHWLIVMPTLRLGEKDKAYAVCGAVPAHASGITYIYGRQASDTRCLEPGNIDQGNAGYGGQEAMIVFQDVFIPWDHVFMNGEYEFAATLVERFTTYHRCSYICKAGVGDVLIGAAAEAASLNGVDGASHIKDKLVEMVHLNETIRSGALASAHEGRALSSGVYLNDDMLANVCKQNVTRFPYEIARLAQDIAGGLMVTMPSEQDLTHAEIGPLVRKYLVGRTNTKIEDRMRILRLIENMTLGRNAVGYLTESLHGAGSPQAQRIQIARGAKLDDKKALARKLAGMIQD